MIEAVVLTLLAVMIGAFIGCLVMLFLLSEPPPPPKPKPEREPEPDPALDYVPEEWVDQ
jgi:hypothetical protein